ncbi:MAG: DinB family protein [Pyrinomonadaceae bacterium]|nr:DinB family protein [Pyrinomonadaceae bacterium]
MKRPEKTEYAEYYDRYISLVEETDIISAMQKQLEEFTSTFSQITEEEGLNTYQEGKWTIKELLGHLIDGERIFAYRAFRFSRADETPLPGFDQDPYIENGNYNSVKLADLLEELVLLRKSNLHFLKNLSENAWNNVGVASDNPITVRALAYCMVGHITHHLNILKDRYL